MPVRIQTSKDKAVALSFKAQRFLALLICLLVLPVHANETRTKQDLLEVQQEIKRSQAKFSEQQSNLKRMEKTLRRVELSVAEHVRALDFTEQGIAENQQQQQILERESSELNKRKSILQNLLAAQLRSAYMNGAHDYSKMLLNQEHATTLERIIVYYDYLNKSRTEQLEELKSIVLRIAKNQQQLDKAKDNLLALKEEQLRRVADLKTAQQEQARQAKQLQDTLKATETAIAYLKDNEQTLRDMLAKLQAEKEQTQARNVTLNGLQGNKGKLPWPLTGRLSNHFGARKHTGLNWNGVVIDAKEGSQIASVYQGQVVFADWLNGYGWVIVLDHGDGFMSLYGHAQTLLKDVGDTVTSGEIIALVGQSGGQQNPGLYFEIRHKGRAVNPIEWCRKS
ncbi:murein hydrolase activator EnvC family protein [Pseudoalteromonas fenneropenaei]|uniref:Murein hydrolase activator EnvC family protein n=1 Tax=Pseudoalteromonas fenneropenaei TaxID=1737459 RepID=A0ABV7CHJ4_9GAMM